MYFTKDEEPGGKNLACTPAIWQEMFSIIDSKNFALNYDPSHMVIMQMDYTLPIYQFPEKIRHIHIKDVQFYREKYNQVGFFAPPLCYHTPKLPGLGDIDWGKFFSALNDICLLYTSCSECKRFDSSSKNPNSRSFAQALWNIDHMASEIACKTRNLFFSRLRTMTVLPHTQNAPFLFFHYTILRRAPKANILKTHLQLGRRPMTGAYTHLVSRKPSACPPGYLISSRLGGSTRAGSLMISSLFPVLLPIQS